MASPSKGRLDTLGKQAVKACPHVHKVGGTTPLGDRMARGTREHVFNRVACASYRRSAMQARPALIESLEMNQGHTTSNGWLNSMVPNLVKKLNRKQQKGRQVTAFVCNSTYEEPLTEFKSDFEAENWQEVLEEAKNLKMNHMNGLLVVKPLFDAPKCPEGKSPVVLERALTGSFGDCCEDEEEVLGIESDWGVGQSLHGNDTVEKSYGLVLQSVYPNSEIDGCYILKTSTSQSIGCSCTQYSMSRALCNNDGSCLSIRNQVDSAWLVNPFTQ